MKALFNLFFITLLFSTYSILSQTDTLTILHVNDTHSCLTPLGPRDEFLKGSRGGIARAATFIGMNKLMEPNVITLHAGDVFIGDIFFNVFFGVAELQIMNSIGFDAMTLGNHEFDLMPTTLETALQNSFKPEEGFPLLSANFILPDDTLQVLKEYVKPFIIKQVGNIKVGIFGLTTPETNLFSFPSPIMFDTNIVKIAADMVDTLSQKECDIVICLSHLGFELDQIIAQYIPNIDVIIGGHDHYQLEKPIQISQVNGKQTYIVQSEAFYSKIGKMKLLISNNSISLLEYELVPLDNSISEEESVNFILNDLIDQVENTYGPIFSQQIGYAESDFEEVADPKNNNISDTPIGNLITDAFRAKTGTDIAIEPGGSTAQQIYEGPIVADDVFRTVGYGFNTVNGLGYRIVTFKMKGSDILSGLEFGLSNLEVNDEFLIQVSGMSYGFEISKPPYERLTNVLINSNQIDPDSTYTVTANEFVLGFLQSFLGIEVTEIFLFEDLTEFQVLKEYIASKGTISPESGDRITNIKKEDRKSYIPNRFELFQNYPNPFNPITIIRFSISQSQYIKLEVFNILGEKISTLISQPLNPGTYEIEWNTNSVNRQINSSVYFNQLSYDNYKEIKKLILLR